MNDLYLETVKPSLKNRSEIKKISSLLDKYFQINYFYYAEVSYKGKYSYFSSKPEWCEYLFAHANELDFFPNLKPCNFPQEINMRFEEPINNTSKTHGIHYLFEFIDHKPDHTEFFGFATSCLKSYQKNILVDQIPLLKLFVKQTKKKYSHLFQDVKKHTYDILPFYKNDFDKSDFPAIPLVNKLDFLKEIEFDVNSYLSSREQTIAALVIKGHSAGEIAEILMLSKRTVESYIISIKDKLNCYSKNELVQKCLELDSIHIRRKI